MEFYRRPELLFDELIRREARGERRQFLQRAVVIAVDYEGGKLQNKDGSGETTFGGKTVKAIVGPENPRGAVKARIISGGFDRLLDDDDARIFWPLFPQDQISIPISSDEHVYVFFENGSFEHGIWISRVSGHESSNVVIGTSQYGKGVDGSTAMSAFEPDEQEFPLTDSYAGEVRPPSAMNAFGDPDVS